MQYARMTALGRAFRKDSVESAFGLRAATGNLLVEASRNEPISEIAGFTLK